MVRRWRWRWWLSTPSYAACTTLIPVLPYSKECEGLRESHRGGSEKRQRYTVRGRKRMRRLRGERRRVDDRAGTTGEGSRRGASRDRSNSPSRRYGYRARRSMVGGTFSKTQLVCAPVVLSAGRSGGGTPRVVL